MPQVKCSVANCFFWTAGNNCGADAIMVEINQHSNRTYREEISGEFVDSEHQDYSANQSADTCCHTFRPKKSQ